MSLPVSYEAGLESAKWNAANDVFIADMKDLGFVSYSAVAAVAPFDVISDFLRGMRGTMLDMYRQPDKLLEAGEKAEAIADFEKFITLSDNPQWIDMARQAIEELTE